MPSISWSSSDGTPACATPRPRSWSARSRRADSNPSLRSALLADDAAAPRRAARRAAEHLLPDREAGPGRRRRRRGGGGRGVRGRRRGRAPALVPSSAATVRHAFVAIAMWSARPARAGRACGAVRAARRLRAGAHVAGSGPAAAPGRRPEIVRPDAVRGADAAARRAGRDAVAGPAALPVSTSRAGSSPMPATTRGPCRCCNRSSMSRTTSRCVSAR